MKKLFFVALMLVGLTSAVFAQSHTGTPKEKAMELQKKLALTDKQCKKVSAIYEESAHKFEKIRKEEKGDNAKMAKALAPVRQETISKIKKELTKRQAAKFATLLKEDSGKNAGWSTGWSADS